MHSVRQLLLNFGPAFRLSVVPFLIAAIVFYLLFQFVEQEFRLLERAPAMPPAKLFLAIFVGLVVYLVAFIWVAVAWHRFVLLEEYPGPLGSKVTKDRFFAYFGASVKVGLIAMLITFVVMFIIGFLIAATGGQSPLVNFVVNVLFQVLLGAFLMRISLVLPASAIGKPLSIGDSLNASASVKFAILTTVVLILLLNMIPSILAGTPLGPLVSGLIYQVLSLWLLTMLGISVLTTYYGHLIEGRELL